MPTELLYRSDAAREFKERQQVISRTKEKVKSLVNSVAYAVKSAIHAGQSFVEVDTNIPYHQSYRPDVPSSVFDPELRTELENVIVKQKGYKMDVIIKSVTETGVNSEGSGPGEPYQVQYWFLKVNGWAE